MSHLGIVSEPSNTTVASKKKTSATGPIESSPGTFTKEGSHKYLKKGAGSKWRNPSGSIPTKTKSSQLNSAAVVRTNHTEVSGASVDELWSEGNERASEMSEFVCASTFHSMNHVLCQNSPSTVIPIPATPMQEETPECLTTSRGMSYTNLSQIVRQEWGSEDREIPLTALLEIRQLRANLAQSEKGKKDLKDQIDALLREQQNMELRRWKEREEENEKRRIKDQEDHESYMKLFKSKEEMKTTLEAEIKQLTVQHEQEKEDLQNWNKMLRKALEKSAIQNKSQEKPTSLTEVGGNKKKQPSESQELGKDQHSIIKGHKDMDKMLPEIQNKQKDGPVEATSILRD